MSTDVFFFFEEQQSDEDVFNFTERMRTASEAQRKCEGNVICFIYSISLHCVLVFTGFF